MAKTHVPTRGQASSRSERMASVVHDPKFIDSQKIPGAMARRGYDVRLVDL